MYEKTSPLTPLPLWEKVGVRVPNALSRRATCPKKPGFSDNLGILSETPVKKPGFFLAKVSALSGSDAGDFATLLEDLLNPVR
jgi:hypothetical protein